MKKHGGRGNYDTAGVGSALLCFYGWGMRHDQGGRYQDNVKRALEWLLKQQKENGDLRGGGKMYCHGIASIALCEAYGVTKDPKLKEAAERAIKLILASQSLSKGGWRYEPAGEEGTEPGLRPLGDRLAIHGPPQRPAGGARSSGGQLRPGPPIPHDGEHRKTGRALWLPGWVGQPTMVATGMFCRQLDLVPPTDPRMPEGADYIGQRQMKVKNPDFYYSTMPPWHSTNTRDRLGRSGTIASRKPCPSSRRRMERSVAVGIPEAGTAGPAGG